MASQTNSITRPRPLIYIKPAVNLVLSTEMAIATGWIARRWGEFGLGDFVITSARDSHPDPDSLHYSGNAIDIRTGRYFDGTKHADEIVQFARYLQGLRVGFRVIVEPDWKPGAAPHLHVGYQLRAGDKAIWEIVG